MRTSPKKRTNYFRICGSGLIAGLGVCPYALPAGGGGYYSKVPMYVKNGRTV